MGVQFVAVGQSAEHIRLVKLTECTGDDPVKSVSWSQLAVVVAHPFFERLDGVLDTGGSDVSAPLARGADDSLPSAPHHLVSGEVWFALLLGRGARFAVALGTVGHTADLPKLLQIASHMVCNRPLDTFKIIHVYYRSQSPSTTNGILAVMKKIATILWIDLEMTGLDPVQDRILEVGAIATDWNFKEIARYEAVKKVGSQLVKDRMVGEFWETHSEVRDALMKQNSTGKNGRIVENELLTFISEHFDSEKPVLLAGNSIHQDRKFIENEWPRLNARLHYRMLDVSAWKVVFEGKYKKKFAKPEAHRATEDIEGSIEELQYYLSKFKR